jgi:hypothetical protein
VPACRAVRALLLIPGLNQFAYNYTAGANNGKISSMGVGAETITYHLARQRSMLDSWSLGQGRREAKP